MITVFGFYKFKKIESLKKYKLFLQREIFTNNIRGTIILSSEGLNGTVAGNKKDIIKITKKFKILENRSYGISKILFGN